MNGMKGMEKISRRDRREGKREEADA